LPRLRSRQARLTAALLASLRAHKEAEEAADGGDEGEEGDADKIPDSLTSVQAKARLAKDARGALRKAVGETDALGSPLMQLLRRLRVAWSPSTSLRSIQQGLCGLDMTLGPCYMLGPIVDDMR